MNSEESANDTPEEPPTIAPAPAECTLEEFLLTVPPGGLRAIKADTLNWKPFKRGGGPSGSAALMPLEVPKGFSMPLSELKLNCSSEKCVGATWFSPYEQYASDRSINLVVGSIDTHFLRYLCKTCEKTWKTYAVWFQLLDGNKLFAYKFGEYPDYGPELPAKVLRLFQSDAELFKKGRKAEHLSFGIAAFAYYRRIVEKHKNELFDKIIKIAEEDPSFGPNKTEALRKAREFTQFCQSVEAIKDAIPESLKMWGQNPLVLLHRAFSEGVHDLSDEECLQKAHTVRTVLIALAERMALVRTENAELKQAISDLMRPKE